MVKVVSTLTIDLTRPHCHNNKINNMRELVNASRLRQMCVNISCKAVVCSVIHVLISTFGRPRPRLAYKADRTLNFSTKIPTRPRRPCRRPIVSSRKSPLRHRRHRPRLATINKPSTRATQTWLNGC